MFCQATTRVTHFRVSRGKETTLLRMEATKSSITACVNDSNLSIQLVVDSIIAFKNVTSTAVAFRPFIELEEIEIHRNKYFANN